MSYKSNHDQTHNLDITCFIHQAALDPHLNLDSLNQICDACIHYNFSGLCTTLNKLLPAKKRLGKHNQTKLIAVIAFPFGDIPFAIKKQEAEWAAEHGAEEIDVVPNFLNLYEGAIEHFAEELSEISSIGLPSRVILDTMKLPKEKLSLAIEACIDAGAQGIQTGNGFGFAANQTHVRELASLIKNRCAIKAAGGIQSLDQALELINAGADSIGTSYGVEITKEGKNHIQQT